jgi:ADP-heptose:LPS heptosyltransferase
MNWRDCKNILCIRLDNMGDLLMSVPAIRAVKESFNANITVLTSSAGKGITKFISCIDDTIVYDVPWVKSNTTTLSNSFLEIIEIIKSRNFDAAIIFTVFSQNPLPSAMIAFLAGIPKRLAYCRENPYELLTDWFPDKEPYTIIKHQVRRDLDLVATIGAQDKNDRISLKLPEEAWSGVVLKAEKMNLDLKKPWIIFHPGVSETKRMYSAQDWIEAGKSIVQEMDVQIVITGNQNEKSLAENIKNGIGFNAFSIAGELTLEEFIMLIKNTALVVSVNTATIHIAAATQTKVIVLYAMTNPQHTPWKTYGKILPFFVPTEVTSKNEVLKFLSENYFMNSPSEIFSTDIVNAAKEILIDNKIEMIPELVPTMETIAI